MSFTNLSAFLHSLELERQQLLDRRYELMMQHHEARARLTSLAHHPPLHEAEARYRATNHLVQHKNDDALAGPEILALTAP